MAALAIAMVPPEASDTLPRWTTPVKDGQISGIRTVEVADFANALKVLQVWKTTYEVFPRDVSAGSHIADRCFFRLGRGKVLVVEDAQGIAQAFARVRKCYNGLYVEELVVAPWNNTPCIKYTKGSLDWALRDSGLKELADRHKIDVKELVVYHPGMGTLMIYGLSKYALSLERKTLVSTPFTGTDDFYTALGMSRLIKEGDVFGLDVSKGIPKVLKERVLKYFPDEIPAIDLGV